MALVPFVVTSDDLTGEVGARPVLFGLNGKSYEVDLTDENAAEMERLLQPYIAVARPVAPPVRDLKAIRAWAQEAGLEVADFGYIPSEAEAAYWAAHA